MDLKKPENLIRKTYRFFARAPDANLFVLGGILLSPNSTEEMDSIYTLSSMILFAWAIKQYNFAAESYKQIRRHIEENPRIKVETLKKLQTEHYKRCYSFGAKYAIKEYEKSLENRL